MLRNPSRTEIKEAGGPAFFGLPAVVPMGATTKAILDVVAASRGAIDPWWVVSEPEQGVVDISTASERLLAVGGMEVGGADVGAVDAALAARPFAADRHSPEGAGMRLAAGLHALQVRDAMVRARLLDIVDGWEALKEGGRVVDTDPEHGQLIEPDTRLELQCRLLLVTCPSTGRRYMLRVPGEFRTARDARLWTLEMEDTPEVET